MGGVNRPEVPAEVLELAKNQIAMIDDIVDGILKLMKPTRIPGHPDYIDDRIVRIGALTQALMGYLAPGMAFLTAATLMERLSQLEHFEDEVPR